MNHRCVSAIVRTALAGACAAVALPGCGSAAPAAAGNLPTARAQPVAPQSVAPATCGLPDFRAKALARVNKVRAAGANCRSEGRFAPAGPLAWNDRLAQAAALHSHDMSSHNFFSHNGHDGRSQKQRIDAAGYPWKSIGENIEAGSRSVDEAVESWMASDHHCANIMDPVFTDLGLACVRGEPLDTYETYWTMELGKQRR